MSNSEQPLHLDQNMQKNPKKEIYEFTKQETFYQKSVENEARIRDLAAPSCITKLPFLPIASNTHKKHLK